MQVRDYKLIPCKTTFKKLSHEVSIKTKPNFSIAITFIKVKGIIQERLKRIIHKRFEDEIIIDFTNFVIKELYLG